MKAKATFKNIGSGLALFAMSLTLFTACSDSKGNNVQEKPTETAPVAEPFTLDALLERQEGLATQEFEDLQVRFDEEKAAYQTDPSNFGSLLKLAEIYIYEARVSGEHPYYYSAANNVLDEIIKNQYQLTEDEYFNALFYKATVQLSQHHFQAALETAEEATAINNLNAGIYGVLVDANVEIGNYDEAVKMCDTMMLIRPDLRSYSRTSYLREIYGDVEGSKEAMKMAIDAGAPYSEYKCWAIVTMGKIYESQGDLDAAMEYYDYAITERENYPFGLAGKANIYAKKGDLEKAKELLNQAIAIVPEIGFHIDMAHLLKEEGNTEALTTKVAEIEEMFKEDIESGHNMNLEYASFLLTFKNDANGALEKANLELADRPNNIDVNKTLATIHYELGNMEKAKNHLEIASATNKQDAELVCLKGLLEENKALVAQSFRMDPYLGNVFLNNAKEMLN